MMRFLHALWQAITPQLWSAVAATCSALAAWSAWRIAHLNLLESVRPEIVLTGWERVRCGEGETSHEQLVFGAIKNIGRGPVLHLYANARLIVDEKPRAFMSTLRLPIIASSESVPVSWPITVFFKNVPALDGRKYLSFNIVLRCFDLRGLRHQTTYTLMMAEEPPMLGSSDIAPGVALTLRKDDAPSEMDDAARGPDAEDTNSPSSRRRRGLEGLPSLQGRCVTPEPRRVKRDGAGTWP
jgi:hypothetical protein